MPLAMPRYTLRDLPSFPDDGSRYELLDGMLLVTPGPAPLHQLVAGRLASALTEYLRPGNPARVFAPGTVEVEPDIHFEPDVLVVPAAALAPGLRPETRWTDIRSWWLAVEVSGKGSMPYDRDYKTPAYLALGVREVWRVDLHARCVFVSRRGVSDVRHEEVVSWRPDALRHPMSLSVPGLFLP